MRIISLLLFFAVLAQTGCSSTGYFGSPNSVLKKDAVVHLNDGTQKNGLLSISMDNTTYPVNFVRLKTNAAEEKIPIESIAFYSINKEVFVAKMVTLDYDGPQRLLFVKRLTEETSKIKLYELTQEKIYRDDGQDLLMYFIALSSFEKLETWGLGSKNLVPNFNEKMSTIVADCPALAEKIRNKEKGYFISQLGLSNLTKREVLLRIIEAYNNCK